MAGTRTNALVAAGAAALVMCAFMVRDTSRSEAQSRRQDSQKFIQEVRENPYGDGHINESATNKMVVSLRRQTGTWAPSNELRSISSSARMVTELWGLPGSVAQSHPLLSIWRWISKGGSQHCWSRLRSAPKTLA